KERGVVIGRSPQIESSIGFLIGQRVKHFGSAFARDLRTQTTSTTFPSTCIKLCGSDVTAETPIVTGDAHLQLLPPPDPEPLHSLSLLSSLSSPQAKRSYSMKHFHWVEPVRWKRRPVKINTSNGVEEESVETFPREMRTVLHDNRRHRNPPHQKHDFDLRPHLDSPLLLLHR
uniref:Uncharacterized protein n=1 Tax=Sparus aurata TaxID=8175 RepID=A0A671TIL7_SPAAU